MGLFYFAVSLSIVANLFYHLIQKSVPANANPILSLIVTYLVALAACLILLPFFLKENLGQAIHKLNWTSIALGIAIIGLELGSLLAYRAGWNISFFAIFSNVAVTLALIPLGILLFHESVTLVNGVGILLCLAGLVLINYR